MPYLGNELPGYLKRCPVALQPIYSAWVLMSGRHLFYNSRGHLVPGIGIQNLLPSGRREPDRFASLQTLSFLIPFARRFKNRRLFNLPIGTGLSDLSSDRSTKEQISYVYY